MAAFVLFFVSVIVFIAVRLCPGDPVASKIGPYGDYSQENYSRIAAEMGLDKSYVTQYFRWVRDFVRLDFGISLVGGDNIFAAIRTKIPASLELIFFSLLLAIVISVPLGVISAIKSGSVFDQIIRVISTGFLAIPSFCFGLLLIIVVCVQLKWLPSNGYVPFGEDPVRNLRYLILPALTLGIVEQAPLTRYIRSEMLEIVNSNYIRTAKAKGLPSGKVFYIHAFKNVLVTVITLIGMRIGQLVGGTVVVEQLFGWSGLGWYLYSSISNRDYPAIQATVMLIAVVLVVINMVIDILYAAIDPRIELE